MSKRPQKSGSRSKAAAKRGSASKRGPEAKRPAKAKPQPMPIDDVELEDSELEDAELEGADLYETIDEDDLDEDEPVKTAKVPAVARDPSLPPERMPVVAIVGRPNVGKSSLSNALLGRRVSIVQDVPGVTRDRISQPLALDGRYIELVDTGGYGFDDPDNLTEHIRHQIELAMARADLALFLVDCQAGLTTQDQQIAQLLRRGDVPTILVANKADNPKIESTATDFARLGFGTPLGVSTTTGRNLPELRDLIADSVDMSLAPTSIPDPQMHMAVVGKRNAGKSTLVNAIAALYDSDDTERVIVSEVPGTTRDAIDVRFEKEGKALIVIDTAGVRKKRHMVSKDLEFYSFHRAQRSVRRADVVVLLIDSTGAVSEPDKQLARYIHELYKPVVIVVNKWDLAREQYRDTLAEQSPGEPAVVRDDELMEKYRTYVRAELRFLDHAPIEFTTAKEGRNVSVVLDLAQHLFKQATERVSTGRLNSAVETAFEQRAPTNPLGRRARIYYATQTGVNPPEIVLFVNKADLFTESYQRYLVNRLRELLPYKQIPIRLLIKGKAGGARPGSALGEGGQPAGALAPEDNRARAIRRPTPRGAGMSAKSVAQRRTVARRARRKSNQDK